MTRPLSDRLSKLVHEFLVIFTTAALLGACTFDPTVPLSPSGQKDTGSTGSDGGRFTTDAGIARDGATDSGDAAVPPDAGTSPDAGPIVDGGGSLDSGPDAIVVVTNGPHTALLWDSVELDASGSYDTGGGELIYTWTIVSAPSGVVDGFAPYPGTNNTTSTGATTTLYVSAIGRYVVRVDVSTSGRSASADLQIDVDGFVAVGPIADTDALAIRSDDGRLFVGHDNGARDYDLATGTGGASACAPAGQVQAITFDPITPVFGHDQSADLQTGVAGACVTLAAPSGPSETHALRRVGADIYAATDAGYVVYSAGAATRHLFNAFLEINVLERDSMGAVWFGSRDESPSDGVIRMLGLHDDNAPRIDLVLGRDDDIEQIRTGVVGELWIATRDAIVHIADVNQPSVRANWTTGNGLPPGATAQIRDLAFDATTMDVWFATDNGLIRYKRDVNDTVFVRIGGGTGIGGGGNMRRLAFDADANRGRTLVLGTTSGTYVSRAP